MLEIKGDLFSYIGYSDAICITTNGFIKYTGTCVMGRGCAKRATQLWPGIDKILGDRIKDKGNIPATLVQEQGTWLCSFPVKPVQAYCLPDKSNIVRHMQHKFKNGERVPGWACVADIEIIKKSAKFLAQQIDKLKWNRIILPRPGCGAGELSWEEVSPVLQQYLDDRFFAITF